MLPLHVEDAAQRAWFRDWLTSDVEARINQAPSGKRSSEVHSECDLGLRVESHLEGDKQPSAQLFSCSFGRIGSGYVARVEPSLAGISYGSRWAWHFHDFRQHVHNALRVPGITHRARSPNSSRTAPHCRVDDG